MGWARWAARVLYPVWRRVPLARRRRVYGRPGWSWRDDGQMVVAVGPCRSRLLAELSVLSNVHEFGHDAEVERQGDGWHVVVDMREALRAAGVPVHPVDCALYDRDPVAWRAAYGDQPLGPDDAVRARLRELMRQPLDRAVFEGRPQPRLPYPHTGPRPQPRLSDPGRE